MKNSLHKMRSKPGRRDGIALVIVLGFLTVMTIISIGLAIAMRTERLTSSNNLNVVKARLHCLQGIANSMYHLEEILYDSRTPPANILAPNFRAYYNLSTPNRPLNYSVFVSGHGTAGGDFADYMPEDEDEHYLDFAPEELYDLLQPSESLPHNPRWIRTESGRGRFAYVGIDVSNWADVNYINPNDEDLYTFIMGQLRQFGAHGDYLDLMRRLDQDVRYETVRELRDYSGISNPETPYGLGIFSYFPQHRIIDNIGDNKTVTFSDFNSGQPIYLSREPTQWDRTQIISAFQRIVGESTWGSHQDAVGADDLYNLLLDYVSPGYESHSLDAPNAKPIPMVDGLRLTDDELLIRVWRPYVGPNRYSGAYTIKARVDGSEVQIAANVDPNVYSPITWTAPLPDLGSDVGDSVNVIVELEIGGALVDRVDFGDVEFNETWLCNDPRFNHIRSQWVLEGDYVDNPWSVQNESYEKDGDWRMYTALQELRLTGELGYLPVAPWRTLKLYGRVADEVDRVLDYFTMQQSDEILMGRFSPNGLLPDVHKGALSAVTNRMGYPRAGLGMWIDQMDSERAPVANSSNNIHRRLYDRVDGWLTEMRNSQNVIVNPSDVGVHLFDDALMDFINQNRHRYSELQIEDVMRRASQFFHPRQNLMLLFTWGQVLSEGSSPQVLSESQAVALVWRDPYPVSATDRYHPKFVRHVRWLE